MVAHKRLPVCWTVNRRSRIFSPQTWTRFRKNSFILFWNNKASSKYIYTLNGVFFNTEILNERAPHFKKHESSKKLMGYWQLHQWWLVRYWQLRQWWLVRYWQLHQWWLVRYWQLRQWWLVRYWQLHQWWLVRYWQLRQWWLVRYWQLCQWWLVRYWQLHQWWLVRYWQLRQWWLVRYWQLRQWWHFKLDSSSSAYTADYVRDNHRETCNLWHRKYQGWRPQCFLFHGWRCFEVVISLKRQHAFV